MADDDTTTSIIPGPSVSGPSVSDNFRWWRRTLACILSATVLLLLAGIGLCLRPPDGLWFAFSAVHHHPHRIPPPQEQRPPFLGTASIFMHANSSGAVADSGRNCSRQTAGLLSEDVWRRWKYGATPATATTTADGPYYYYINQSGWNCQGADGRIYLHGEVVEITSSSSAALDDVVVVYSDNRDSDFDAPAAMPGQRRNYSDDGRRWQLQSDYRPCNKAARLNRHMPSRIVDYYCENAAVERQMKRTITGVNKATIAATIGGAGRFLAQESSPDGFQDYELVYPVTTSSYTASRDPVSDLHDGERIRQRNRRSSSPGEPANETNYIIQAFGKSFHFNWVEKAIASSRVSILSPNFVVHRIGEQSAWLDQVATSRNTDWQENCLRIGTVNGDLNSKAVMDLCWNTLHNVDKQQERTVGRNVDHQQGQSDRHGLMGAFHVADGDYLVQPAGDLQSVTSDQHYRKNSPAPHIVYRTRHSLPPASYHNSSSIASASSSDPYVHLLDRSQHNRTRRGKREVDVTEFAATAWDYHVELLIVADYSMRQFHGKDLDEYILTLMSIVGMIYRDASIGNSISISIAKLIVLESEAEGPRISWSAQDTLESFCKWQSGYNMQDETHPYHHDAALLITRQDLCRIKNKCDTLGLAEIGTMCDSEKSCAIVEDSGLSSAFTIAHELGHLFNIPHDDDRICRAHMPSAYSSYTSVMAPRLDHNSNPWTWSACSAKKLMDYLDSGEASCLLDEPSAATTNNIPTAPRRAYLTQGRNDPQLERMSVNSFLFPGEMFEVDKQCQLVFGDGAAVCPFMPMCKRLWCTTSLGNQTGCRTQHLPWADGTFCGFNMWCKRGECVNKDFTRLDPVNGKWGTWSRWGRCSRTCGGGIKESIRECDSPKPLNGGKYCAGQRVRYKSCNIKECDSGQLDFREEQCAAFNGKTMGYKGVEPNVIWNSKLYGQTNRQKCKLYCKVEGTSKFFLLKEKVIDGTSCGPDPADICVNGVCKKAGCDGKLGSQMSRDTCGVCGGDNSTCRTVSGTYNERNYGYNFVVEIPEGASNIDIRQHAYEGMKDDYNYLALANKDGTYLFNGDLIVSIFRKEIPVKNAVIDYTGSDTIVERINCTAAVGETLSLYVLTVGQLFPPDIFYTYMISAGDEYRWDSEGPWNVCSKECKGMQYRNLLCVRKSDRHQVTKGNCMGKAPPAEHSRPCNDFCSLRWDVIQDSDTQCNAPCNQQGTIKRKVRCLRDILDERPRHGEAHLWFQDSLSSVDQRNAAPRTQEVDVEKCSELSDPKPPEELACTGSCRVVGWKYTSWSECSRPCGGGVQSRNSVCVDLSTGVQVPPYNCSFHQTPEPVQKPCNPQPCAADWTVGIWSPCSVSCGQGIMRRAVKCLLRTEGTETDDSMCDPLKKLPVASRCPIIPCPPPPISRPPPIPKPPVMAHAAQKAVASSAVEWSTGPWTPCSKTCGGGEKYRSVGCRGVRNGQYLSHMSCSAIPKPHEREKCFTGECGAWQFGEWGPCTATCEDGLGGAMQRRYVACIVEQKPIKDEDECDKTTRPDSSRHCPNLPTCEFQTVLRMIDSGNRDGSDPLREVRYQKYFQPLSTTQTTQTTRPLTTVRVPDPPRQGVWVMGPYGKCSKACGGGMRARLVVCKLPDSYVEGIDVPVCDETKRPANLTKCNDQGCPEWNFGQWGHCNKTCDGGYQRRIVQCVDSRGSHMSSHQCSRLSERPASLQRCNTHRCEDSDPSYPLAEASVNTISRNEIQSRGYAGQWRTGPWSPCGSSCGKSSRKRQVLCVGKVEEGKELDAGQCPPSTRPPATEECRRTACPKWRFLPWGECSTNCGVGVQTREISCARGGFSQHLQATMSVLNESMCQSYAKPKNRRPCEVYQCPGAYQWSVTRWSPCSASCDRGKQTRQAQCVYSGNNSVIDSSHCRIHLRDVKTPVTVKMCKAAKPCAFRWESGRWSDCSRSCGNGVKGRRVNCHKVAENGNTIWFPLESPYRCDTRNRPKERQLCSLGDCASHFLWQVDPWSECSVSCGGGVSKRGVYCLHQKSQRRLRHNFCKSGLRPDSTTPCNPEPCNRLNEVFDRSR